MFRFESVFTLVVKEFRFILPSLCLFMPIVQHGWIVAFEWIRKTNQNRCWTRFLQCLVFAPQVKNNNCTPYPLFVLFLTFFLQIGMTVYFGLFHQRGPLSVMARIVELNGNCSGPCVQSVDFLTPCHAAPFYARTHIKPEKLRLRTLNVSRRVKNWKKFHFNFFFSVLLLWIVIYKVFQKLNSFFHIQFIF